MGKGGSKKDKVLSQRKNRSSVSDRAGKELLSFSAKISKLSSPQLDRDLAELKIDINFLEEQVKADPRSYSPQEFRRSQTRILFLKSKAQLIEKELDKKNETQR